MLRQKGWLSKPTLFCLQQVFNKTLRDRITEKLYRNQIMLKYIISVVLSSTLFTASIAETSEPANKVKKKGSKLAKVYGIDRPFWTPNRIGNYITNNGQLVSHIPTGSAGMEWPLGSGNHINFASGLWLAGMKDGEIVTAAAEFVTEFQPGNVTGHAPGLAGTPANPEDKRFKVYIINQGDELEPLRNPDYLNWPVEHGAPVDENGKPLLLGTSTAWAVFNDFDDSLHTNLFQSKPMGVEVQMTAWAFDRLDAFGDMMFFKFLFINKSGTDITDSFVTFWADIDIDDALDLVGCDTTLSLGYMYKTQPSPGYGDNAPAIGYDFFQGPIVPSPGDTANVSGRKVPDFKNLGLTSFNKYIGPGPPQFSDPANALEAYRYMSGLNALGDPIIDPITGRETKFWHPGDPVTGEGWVNTDHNSDKRFLMSSGPFTLADGDTQEVVTGIVIARGETGLESVSLLKRNTELAQLLYDANFETATPPPSPRVSVFSEENAITLNWDTLAESYEVIDRIDLDSTNNPTSFTFQGYNVYQLDAPDFSFAKQIVKIASFDLIDGVVQIRDDVFSEEFGQTVNVVVQDARDTGLQRFLRITEDALQENAPLIQNQPYYFAVTAYGFNPFGIPRTLESRIEVIEVRPQSSALGTTYSTAFGDTLASVHVAGKSQGEVIPLVVNPAELTGNTYEVRFRETEEGVVYDVVDVTINSIKASGFKDQGSVPGSLDFPLVDGILVKVLDPIAGFTNFETISNAAGPLNPADGAAADFRGFPTTLRPTDTQQVGEGHWMIHIGDDGSGERASYQEFLDIISKAGENWRNIVPYDYEWRFTEAGGYAYDPFLTNTVFSVPFELWQIGIATPDDPSDDIRMIPYVLDDDSSMTFNMPVPGTRSVGVDEHSASGANNDPYTDWVNWAMPNEMTPGDAGYRAWEVAALAIPGLQDSGEFYNVLVSDNNMREMVLINWNGGEMPPFNQDLPETGTVFRISSSKINTPGDVFSFESVAPKTEDLRLARQQAAKLVNVFPNPYHRNIVDLNNPFEQFVTFTHLPEEEVTIHIFTIYGDLVRKIRHTNGTQFEEWGLRNSDGRAVASGMYIVRIDMGEIGVKVLKLGVL